MAAEIKITRYIVDDPGHATQSVKGEFYIDDSLFLKDKQIGLSTDNGLFIGDEDNLIGQLNSKSFVSDNDCYAWEGKYLIPDAGCHYGVYRIGDSIFHVQRMKQISSDYFLTKSGGVISISISSPGTGYTSNGSGVLPSGGSGTGLYIDYQTDGDAITSVNISQYYEYARGSGYYVSDTVTIPGGNGDAQITINTVRGGYSDFSNLLTGHYLGLFKEDGSTLVFTDALDVPSLFTSSDYYAIFDGTEVNGVSLSGSSIPTGFTESRIGVDTETNIGVGYGLKLNYESDGSGGVTNIEIYSYGSGYTIGDQVSIPSPSGGGDAVIDITSLYATQSQTEIDNYYSNYLFYYMSSTLYGLDILTFVSDYNLYTNTYFRFHVNVDSGGKFGEVVLISDRKFIDSSTVTEIFGKPNLEGSFYPDSIYNNCTPIDLENIIACGVVSTLVGDTVTGTYKDSFVKYNYLTNEKTIIIDDMSTWWSAALTDAGIWDIPYNEIGLKGGFLYHPTKPMFRVSYGQSVTQMYLINPYGGPGRKVIDLKRQVNDNGLFRGYTDGKIYLMGEM